MRIDRGRDIIEGKNGFKRQLARFPCNFDTVWDFVAFYAVIYDGFVNNRNEIRRVWCKGKFGNREISV